MDPFVSHDPDKIIAEIASRIAGVRQPLVAVDGTLGAGKSHLATLVAQQLGLLCVDLDNYLVPEMARQTAGYAVNLRLDDLHRDIDSGVSGVILSGICMRDALRLLGCEATVHVYVKRWDSSRNHWKDEEDCGLDALPYVTAGLRDSHGEAIK